MVFEDNETFDPVACDLSIGLCQILDRWLSAWNLNSVSKDKVATNTSSKLGTNGRLDDLTIQVVVSEIGTSSSAGN